MRTSFSKTHMFVLAIGLSLYPMTGFALSPTNTVHMGQ